MRDAKPVIEGWRREALAAAGLEPAPEHGSLAVRLPGAAAMPHRLVRETNRAEVFVLDLEDLLRAIDADNNILIPDWQSAVGNGLSAAQTALLARELGLASPSMIVERSIGGRPFVIIRGYAGLRKMLTGTRYSPLHRKMLLFSLGKKASKAAPVIIGSVVIFLYAGEAAYKTLAENEPEVERIVAEALVGTGSVIVSGLAGYGAGLVAASLGAPVVITLGVATGAGYLVNAGYDYMNDILDLESRVTNVVLEVME